LFTRPRFPKLLGMASTLHLICGSDDFLVEQKARQIVETSVPEAERALGLEMVDGRVDTVDAARAAIRQVLEAVQTAGFFGGTKLTWLKNASFLSPLVAPGDSDTVKATLAELTACIKAGLPEGQRLLITALTIARNSAFFKACQTAGEVMDFGGGERPWEQEKLARERLEGLLGKFGLHMADDVRDRFLARTGTATRLMVQELEKLSLYLGKTPAEVTAEQVDAVVSMGREAEAWDLTDAVGQRNPANVIRSLRQLQTQDENAIKLAAMVETRVRDLLVLRQAIDQGWLQVRSGGRGATCQWLDPMPPEADALLRALPKDPRQVPPFIQGKNAAQASLYTLNELRRARHLLIELREKLVSSSVSPDLLIEMALLRIVGGRKVAGAPRRPAA